MERTFYENNRHRLLTELLTEEQSLLVLFSGKPRRRTADEDYPFYASRSFVYVTGLEKEDLVYLAYRTAGEVHETLFLPPVDAMRERWRGRMLHPEQVETISGIVHTAPRNVFDDTLQRLMAAMPRPALYLDFDLPAHGYPAEASQEFAAIMRRTYPWCALRSCHGTLRRMRTVKQSPEIAQLRESIRLTGEGIRAVLQSCRPGVYEYQLRAVFEKVLADAGWRVPAFDTIVAAGKNALVMHYPEQDARIESGDMVLVDLGAQCGHCGADISRVFPADGHFTARQRQLQAASVDTIDYLCTHVQAGLPMQQLNPMTHDFLRRRLRDIGLSGEPKDYCWHNVSHHLGFDTHDDNDYAMPVAPGMVFTMEVGIYVPQWGEGVRMEDDILMTDHGCENLSLAIPRTAQALEAAMVQG